MAIHLESWPAGTPCWVDISVSDPEASRTFYADVLGWEFTESTEEFGGYFMALVDGQRLSYAGRAPSASPAVGYYDKHYAQQKELIAAAFGEKAKARTGEAKPRTRKTAI